MFPEQGEDDLLAGVVGISDEEDRLLQNVGGAQEHLNELVQKGSLVAIRKDEPFVDTTEQGNGEDLSSQWYLDKQAKDLEGVAGDELGLGIIG